MAESAPSQSTTVLPEEIAQQWARTRLAHEAVMLQDAAESLRLDRARTQAHQREFLGPSWSDPQGGEVIHIGDVHQAAPLPVAKEVSASQPSTVGTLAKVAMAFAVGGPIGAGLAAMPYVASFFSKPAATIPAVAQPTPVESPEIPTIKPNIYGLELVPPK